MFVLASSSRYRAAVLRSAGLACVGVAPEVDERDHDRLLIEHGPAALACTLARLKASSVIDTRWPAELSMRTPVIAADQVGVVDLDDGRVGQLHQPGTLERAIEQILWCSGRRVRLINGLVGVRPDTGRIVERTDEHHLFVDPVTETEAAEYVDATNPIDCLGGIRIEDCQPLGPWTLIRRVHSSGDDGIQGMPLTLVREVLDDLANT